MKLSLTSGQFVSSLVRNAGSGCAGAQHPHTSARITLHSSSSSFVGAPIRPLPRPSPAAPRSRRSALVTRSVFERFTERCIQGILMAQHEARKTSSSEVSSEHILLGLVMEDQKRTKGTSFMGATLSAETVRDAVRQLYGPQASSGSGGGGSGGSSSPAPDSKPPTDAPFSTEAKAVFECALRESRKMNMSYIAPEHILVALLASGDKVRARRVIVALHMDPEAMKAEAMRRVAESSEAAAGSGASGGAAAQGAPGSGAAAPKKAAHKPKVKQDALEEFCLDLVLLALGNRIDQVIGRDEEIGRVIQILARRTKHNVVLLGEPGVGKTAIAEGLAHCIASQRTPTGEPLPEFLRKKRVLRVDVGLLIAGAKERGELESRVTRLIKEAREAKNVILMIDEIHTVVGAGAVGKGGGGGGLDIANLMKPALARGEIQVIGATTIDEYRKHIERDAALERRFQPLMVGEPTPDEALQILRGLRSHYERHHSCSYTDDALRAAVELSARYIHDRFLPDKAIDIMDEAGSRARIQAYLAKKAIRPGTSDSDRLEARQALFAEFESVLDAKKDAVRHGHYEEAALLRAREQDMTTRLSGRPEDAAVLAVVDVSDMERVVSSWSGIPVEKVSADETAKLADLPHRLGAGVVGQGAAVVAISHAMQRARSGLKDPKRPIASMLFSGPTGVGKTELARVLAAEVFGSRDHMTRLDMSEYMERHSVSKLIGSPPGYVGYTEGGQLTEAVRRRPFQVLLFDELEKAHPDAMNILLQVLEDGRLTDSMGRTVDFRNTVIILTSNIGSSIITRGGASLGFGLQDPSLSATESAYQQVRTLFLEELRNYFRPEFLNRLDDIVVFRQLEVEHLRVIAGKMLEEVAARLEDKGVGLRVTERLMDLLLREGYDKDYGARPMRRTVARVVEDRLAEELLHKRAGQGDVVVMDVDPQGRAVVLPRGAHVPQAPIGDAGPTAPVGVVVPNPVSEEREGEGEEEVVYASANERYI